MDYAIIAAGEGSRLAQEGVKWPKPLVRLNGVALIDRLIDVFMKNNATSISNFDMSGSFWQEANRRTNRKKGKIFFISF